MTNAEDACGLTRIAPVRPFPVAIVYPPIRASVSRPKRLTLATAFTPASRFALTCAPSAFGVDGIALARYGLCYGTTSRNPPVREETKMKYVVIALVSSPVLLAYNLKPDEVRQALAQLGRYLLLHLTGG
jgi:hypothetical protein